MISLCRIDDRLIHGQVATQWLKYSGANYILIVDDSVAADTFLVQICKTLAPNGITVEVSMLFCFIYSCNNILVAD